MLFSSFLWKRARGSTTLNKLLRLVDFLILQSLNYEKTIIMTFLSETSAALLTGRKRSHLLVKIDQNSLRAIHQRLKRITAHHLKDSQENRRLEELYLNVEAYTANEDTKGRKGREI